ncbi:hypothetical protein Trydic_g19076 [Trypoxylus dichotomus]
MQDYGVDATLIGKRSNRKIRCVVTSSYSIIQCVQQRPLKDLNILMAVCVSNKVITIKAFEIGLILLIFFFCTPAFSAPATASMSASSIDVRLENPCGYIKRPQHRHSRSAKEKPLDKQFRIFQNEYKHRSRPRILELYPFQKTISAKLPVEMPKNAFKNMKKNYEALQLYIKAFDTFSKQDGVQPTGNFTLDERKSVLDSLANDSIRLLCVMFDEQKKKQTKLNKRIKKIEKQFKTPNDFTALYTQDSLLLENFDRFFKSLEVKLPKRKKNNGQGKRKNGAQKNKKTPQKKAKPSKGGS